ncbi:hypothetical protein [Herbidospora mongoliensis]|uniref:hypothetical protein n=1 Tax=Herbidospora mongoliensis TaxID=688067 RepID=UPI0008341679|nr:hypothetical protein [Herbidospora mongoliensis]
MLRLSISVALVLAGASAAGGAATKDPWPGGGDLAIFLCEEGSLNGACEAGPATPDQRRAIQATLEGDPRLAAVRYSSPEQTLTYWETRAAATRSKDPSEESPELRLSEMSGSVNARVLRAADLAAVEADHARFPGAWLVSLTPRAYWDDKGDTFVTMCGNQGEFASSACAGRGAATEAERQAVEDALEDIDGAVVYRQSPAFTLWTEVELDARRDDADGPRGEWDVVETDYYSDSFVADLPGTPGAALLDRLIGMPGVHRVAHFQET